MEQFTHSVMLDKELCMGCINCIKRCPTEAIRVRDGKAHILKERCIDCGECIRICPHHAKKAITDPVSIVGKLSSIPLPFLRPVYTASITIWKNRTYCWKPCWAWASTSVFEVAKAAELVSDATRRLLQHGQHEPAGHQLCLSGGHAAHPRALSRTDRPCAAAGGAHRAGRAHGQKRGRAQNRPAQRSHRLHLSDTVPGQGDGHALARRLCAAARWTAPWPIKDIYPQPAGLDEAHLRR